MPVDLIELLPRAPVCLHLGQLQIAERFQFDEWKSLGGVLQVALLLNPGRSETPEGCLPERDGGSPLVLIWRDS